MKRKLKINIENKLHKDEYVLENPDIKENIFLYMRNDIENIVES